MVSSTDDIPNSKFQNQSTRLMSMPMANFTDRVVLFADILGFTNAIADAGTSPALIKSIANAVNRIFHRRAITEMSSTTLHNLDTGTVTEISVPRVLQYRPRVYTFSDNIAVSLPADPMGLAIALTDIRTLYGELAQNCGLMVRGAVTVGPLYDDGNCIFGPALIEAHKLESTVAVNPRIILSESAVALHERMREISHDEIDCEPGSLVAINHFQSDPSGSMKTVVLCPKVITDTDGQTFLDTIGMPPRWNIMDDADSMITPTLEQWHADLRALAEDQLVKFAKNTKVASKYEWIVSQLDSASSSHK